MSDGIRTRDRRDHNPAKSVLQQRGLAHARFAPHHQCAALTGANSVDGPVEQLGFVPPTLKICGTGSHGGVSEHQEITFVIRPPSRARG